MAKKKQKRAHGQGRVHARGKAGYYYLEYRNEGKRHHRRLLDDRQNPITNRPAAEAAADKIMRAIRAEDVAQKQRILLTEAASAEKVAADLKAEANRHRIDGMWESHPYTRANRGDVDRPLSAGTVRDNRSQWSKFVAWADAEDTTFAESVDHRAAERFRQHLIGTGLSGARVNVIVATCRVMYALSSIEPNPFADLKHCAHEPRGREALTPAEIRALGEKSSGEMRMLLAIGLHLALRLGDAVRLTWESVSPDLSTVELVPSKTSYTGKKLTLAVNEHMRAVLASVPANERKGRVVPRLAARYEKDTGTLSRDIQNVFIAAGIKTTEVVDGKTRVLRGFHSLRHSALTFAARNGVPLHALKAFAGHSNIATLERYLHADEEDRRDTAAAIASNGELLTTGAEDPTAKAEAADRQRLAELAETLPIARVRQLLADCS